MAKQGAEKVQSAAIGHNSGNLKAIIKDLSKLKAESDDIKMRTLNAYNAAEDQGFDRKALKAIMKEINNPLPVELKVEINRMRDMCGDLPLFNAAILTMEEELNDNEAA